MMENVERKDIIEDIKKQIGGAAEGLTLAVPGIGIIAGTYYLPVTGNQAKYKTYGYLLGSGLIGLGFAKYVKYETKKNKSIEPEPDMDIPLTITDPSPGESWSAFFPHTINATIQNPQEDILRMWVGCSLLSPDYEITDLEPRFIVLDPGEIKKVSWTISHLYKGTWYVRSSIWNRLPSGDCEADGTCYRLNDTGWIPFNWTFFGIGRVD